MAVDVFIAAGDHRGIRESFPENVFEGFVDLASVGRRQHTGTRERSCPRAAPRHIVLKETAIDAERRAPLEDLRIGRGVETS